MPQSIPPGLRPDHVLRTLAELYADLEHEFGPATGYELLNAGKRYAPKAVVGLACRYSLGRVSQELRDSLLLPLRLPPLHR